MGEFALRYCLYTNKERDKFYAPALEKFDITPRKRICPKTREYAIKLFSEDYTHPQIVKKLEERNIKCSSMFVCKVVKNHKQEQKLDDT